MDWTTIGLVSHLLLWAVVLVQVVLTLALARLVGQLMSRRFPALGARVIDPGPELGTTVDGWEGTDLHGTSVQFPIPRPRGLFLFYLSPHCSICTKLLPTVKQFFKEIAAEAEGVWVFVLGSKQARLAYAQQHELTQQTVLAEENLPLAWRLGGAPFGVWISATGEVKGKGMTNNREHLESLRNAARTGHPTFQSFFTEQAAQQAAAPERL
jgi:methylamine dehydrogenase accessory protein MauD